jgi:acetylornithine deacetylase
MTTLEQVIELTASLVSFDTVSSKSNLPLVDFVEAYLREQGLEPLRVFNETGEKAALFVTIGPQIDGGVILSGHTDVVPVAGQSWTGDPFALRRIDSRLVGRGAVDMKGFDAVCLAMVPEFKAASLKRPVHLLLSFDEETTCRGSLGVIERFGRDLPRPSAAIIGEPTSMRVADAHKSVTTHVTKVFGHEVHSANPHKGVSAVHMACLLVAELDRLAREFEMEGDPSGRFDPPYSTIHVGVIQGGTARNILAKNCEFHWEFRGLPGTPGDLAQRRLEGYAAQLHERFRRFPQAGIETTIEVEVPGLAPSPGSSAEVLALRLAQTNHTIAVPYASEAGQFQKAGVASIICGPGRIDEAHQPDEFVEIDELARCLAFMRRLAKELGA